MKINVIKIAYFAKQQLLKTCNENIDFLTGGFIEKTKDILTNCIEEDYESSETFYSCLQPVICELSNAIGNKNISLNDKGISYEDDFTGEDYTEEEVLEITHLIALYFILKFTYVRNLFHSATEIHFTQDLQKLFDKLYNNKRLRLSSKPFLYLRYVSYLTSFV